MAILTPGKRSPIRAAALDLTPSEKSELSSIP